MKVGANGGDSVNEPLFYVNCFKRKIGDEMLIDDEDGCQEGGGKKPRVTDGPTDVFVTTLVSAEVGMTQPRPSL